MSETLRHETEGENFRLVVEERSDHFQVFVYDPIECEVVYTAARVNLQAAKAAAVEYAATSRFGPRHELKPEVIAAMLIWDPA